MYITIINTVTSHANHQLCCCPDFTGFPTSLEGGGGREDAAGELRRCSSNIFRRLVSGISSLPKQNNNIICLDTGQWVSKIKNYSPKSEVFFYTITLVISLQQCMSCSNEYRATYLTYSGKFKQLTYIPRKQKLPNSTEIIPWFASREFKFAAPHLNTMILSASSCSY